MYTIITGSNGMIGQNFANLLSINNFKLILLDINTENLIKKFSKNRNVIIRNLDVTKEKSWETLVKFINKNNLKIDNLINNAGFTNHTNKKLFHNNFFKIDKESMMKVFEVNFIGVALGCKYIGQEMIKRKYGSIVNIASMYSLQSPRHYIYKNTGIFCPVSYPASKSSVVSLTKYLGTLFAKDGVRVNSISPGGLQDPTHKNLWLNRFSQNNPTKRMGKAKELNSALLYLLDKNSSYTTASNVVVDGGWTSW